MQAKFWGVRGSTPTPGIENLRYGGNTACVEIQLGSGRSLIFDAGTGVRLLGAVWSSPEAHLFLTHFHWDHIGGIPFFSPLYRPTQTIEFYGQGAWGSLKTILEGPMASPYFPVNLDLASASKGFHELDGAPVRVDDATIHPFPLNHPQGAYGYRIEQNGAAIVYATDHEHGDPRLDATLREFSQGADLLIYDAQYTQAEYEQHRGWGHSTWFEATRAARDARVGRLILFHHDPSRTDEALDGELASAREHFEQTEAAQEGRTFPAGRKPQG